MKSFFILILVLLSILTVASPVFADVSLNNPFKNAGTIQSITGNATPTVLDIVVGAFLGFASIIALFAFGFLIFSGFKMILARDNPEALTVAKNAVLGSVMGFVAALLSVTIILSVGTLLGSNSRDELATPDQLQPPINSVTFVQAFIRVITGILALAFVVSVLMAIYGGYRMIFSGGNEEQTTAGKTILKWAVVGLAVVMLSYSIIYGLNRLVTRLPSISDNPSVQNP